MVTATTNDPNASSKAPSVETAATTRSSSSSVSASAAYYGILPAVASTVCCWGPPLLSMMGAATSAGVGTATKAENPSSTTTTTAILLRHITKYRPYLLGLSATMIGYSFFQVYGQQQQSQGQGQGKRCCNENDNPNENLKFQRAVVWSSLAVAIAGASYGRVKLPKTASASAAHLFSGKPASIRNGAPKATTRTTPTTTIHLAGIQGMACTGCANKVQTAMETVSGVRNVVQVDHVKGIAVVEGDDNINIQTLKTAIENAGFRVR